MSNKDEGDWRERQGFMKGLEYALAIPNDILTDARGEEEEPE